MLSPLSRAMSWRNTESIAPAPSAWVELTALE
jgi:hypothetical protein